MYIIFLKNYIESISHTLETLANTEIKLQITNVPFKSK
jgi:hypothetical protein